MRSLILLLTISSLFLQLTACSSAPTKNIIHPDESTGWQMFGRSPKGQYLYINGLTIKDLNYGLVEFSMLVNNRKEDKYGNASSIARIKLDCDNKEAYVSSLDAFDKLSGKGIAAPVLMPKNNNWRRYEDSSSMGVGARHVCNLYKSHLRNKQTN